MRVEALEQTGIAADRDAHAITALVAGGATESLEAMRNLARQAFGLELVVERRVEGHEQVAVLRDLVAGAGARGELVLVSLQRRDRKSVVLGRCIRHDIWYSNI